MTRAPRTHSVAATIGLCWSTACVPKGVPPESQTSAPRASAQVLPPAPAPAPSAVVKTDVDADRVVADALVRVSAIRELPALAKVRGVTLTRAQISEQVRGTIDREVPPEVMAAQGDLLIALGVVPTDFDYRASVVTLMSAELAGYYEPHDKTMYLVADLGAAESAAALSHELAHALQDQHYDLQKLLDFHKDESDLESAVHALAEGDATSAMLDAALAEKGMHATDISDALLGVQVRMAEQFSDKAPSVPEILKRSLIGPYIDGILLVHFLRRRGGWAEVDRVWHSPPTTTEQLLHPEKLLAHEAALVVAAPPAPEGFPASSAFADVLGEQSLRQLLEEWVPRQTAEADAAGWGGDRLAVFRDHDRVAAAIHLTADTVQDAVRQAQGLSRGVSAQGGTEHGLASCAERSDRGPLRIERRGRDIVIVAGPYRIDGGTARSAGSCSTAAAWSGRIFSGR